MFREEILYNGSVVVFDPEDLKEIQGAAKEAIRIYNKTGIFSKYPKKDGSLILNMLSEASINYLSEVSKGLINDVTLKNHRFPTIIDIDYAARLAGDWIKYKNERYSTHLNFEMLKIKNADEGLMNVITDFINMANLEKDLLADINDVSLVF